MRQPCGDARSGYTHTATEYKHHVEQNVDNGRCDEKIEWLARIAEGTYLTREEIEAECEWYGGKLRHKEYVGIVEDVGRSVDQLQDSMAEHKREQRHHRSDYSRYSHGISYVDAHLAIVLCAECLCYGNCKSCTSSVAESHNEKHYGRRRTHSCQRTNANPSAYNGGIDDEIHLLQNVAQYEWQGKLADLAQWRTYGHVAD